MTKLKTGLLVLIKCVCILNDLCPGCVGNVISFFFARGDIVKILFVFLSQSPVEAREDKATIKCETSPPSSPRSLRLDQMNFAQLTGSLEDGRG